MSIITKIIKDRYCKWCGGVGCKRCNDIGHVQERYSYFIDDKNKIAFGGEVGQ